MQNDSLCSLRRHLAGIALHVTCNYRGVWVAQTANSCRLTVFIKPKRCRAESHSILTGDDRSDWRARDCGQTFLMTSGIGAGEGCCEFLGINKCSFCRRAQCTTGASRRAQLPDRRTSRTSACQRPANRRRTVTPPQLITHRV